MGPFRQEVVLDEPDALKPHLLGKPYLIDDLSYALMLCLRGGRAGHLYLVEQTESHAVFPLPEIHHTHAYSSHRDSSSVASLRAILVGTVSSSNPYDNMLGRARQR